jgi:hypothetical protein
MLALLIAPRAAHAQVFKAPGEPVVGELYHIEVSGNLWFPTSNVVVSSEALGIRGDRIDLVNDLGIGERTNFREFRLVLRPSDKHKFKIQYVPLTYTAASRIQRQFVFNGLRYPVNIPVQTAFDWKMWRLGYEYDFFYRPQGYAGFMIDARLTDARIELTAPPPLGREFARARGPVPSIGFTGRYYVVPNVSVSSELSFFKIPETLDEQYRAKYIDFDIYGTVNFVNWAGAQVGYRRFNINYALKKDTGDLTINGLYFAGVVRY